MGIDNSIDATRGRPVGFQFLGQLRRVSARALKQPLPSASLCGTGLNDVVEWRRGILQLLSGSVCIDPNWRSQSVVFPRNTLLCTIIACVCKLASL
jgi:hypothetical protein